MNGFDLNFENGQDLQDKNDTCGSGLQPQFKSIAAASRSHNPSILDLAG